VSRLRATFCRALAGLLLAWLAVAPAAQAHEARPAYLEIEETTPGQYDVRWRTPVLSGMRLPIVLRFSDGVRNLREPLVQSLADSILERRWIDAGPDGLPGTRIDGRRLAASGRAAGTSVVQRWRGTWPAGVCRAGTASGERRTAAWNRLAEAS